MLLEYLRIICVFLYSVPHIGSNSQNNYYYYYFYKYFSVPYVCNFVDFNVTILVLAGTAYIYIYIYESIALLIWALSIPLFQIHILHIWLIIIIF